MYVRGIRGATTVEHNSETEILQATKELLETIIIRNDVEAKDIASVFITLTVDLDAIFPARAIRDMDGWDQVPLMCSSEIPVPNSLPSCIRLLLHCNTLKEQHQMQHVYLRNATVLRPDLVEQ